MHVALYRIAIRYTAQDPQDYKPNVILSMCQSLTPLQNLTNSEEIVGVHLP